MDGVDFKVFAGPAADPEGRVAALCLPGGAAMSRKEIDDYTAVRRSLRRQGAGLYQGQRCRRRPRRPAVADPEVPARCRCQRHSRAHRCEERRPDFLRRRQGAHRQRCARRAAREGRRRSRPGRRRLGAALGRRFPDVRERRTVKALDGAASPVHGAEHRRCRCAPRQSRARPCRVPTTWC